MSPIEFSDTTRWLSFARCYGASWPTTTAPVLDPTACGQAFNWSPKSQALSFQNTYNNEDDP